MLIRVAVVIMFLLFSFISAPVIFSQKFKPAEPIKSPRTKPRPDLSGAKSGIVLPETKPFLTPPRLRQSIETARVLIESRTKELNQEILKVKQYYGITERESMWSDEARERINNLNTRRTRLTRERQLLSIYKGRGEYYEMIKDNPSVDQQLSKDIITMRKESFLQAATELRKITSGISGLTDNEKLDILKNINNSYSSLFADTTIQNQYDILISRALRGDSRAMIDLRTLFIDESAREQGWLEGMEIVAQNSSKDIEVLIAEDQKKILDNRNKTLREVLGLKYGE